MTNPEIVRDVLGAMITPAFLISASGTLVLSTSNRLGRVVDRVRVLAVEAESLRLGTGSTEEELADKQVLITDQVARLTARIRYLQSAVTTLYLAIGLFVGTSIAVGLATVFPAASSWIPVGLGMAGAGALFVGSALLVREARMAVRSTLNELAYVQKLVARKMVGQEAGRVR